MKKLTKKQEQFALNLFNGLNQTEAYIQAGYSNKQALPTLYANACRLAVDNKVVTRLEQLRKKAEDASVMNVLERKQRLTEIARSRLTDFMELGQDGSWVNIGKETPNTGAIQEIHSRTEYDDNGSKPTVYTSVKLHDPMRAMDLLNKMDGSYPPIRTELTGKDGEPIQVELDAKTKLFGILFNGATRIRDTEESGQTLTAGSSSDTLRLDSVGQTESNPP